MYFTNKSNVNSQYLSNVFCVAKHHGLDLPVYEIHYCPEREFTGNHWFDITKHIKDDAFGLMICGNENHESVDHYLSDKRVKVIFKNYPLISNVTDEGTFGQTYGTFIDSTGREKFIVEKESENIITLPLGYCNDFNPVPTNNLRVPGGFIGQYTQFRNDKITAIQQSFEPGQCPYEWGFYKGFGPFVQKDFDGAGEKFNHSLKPPEYSDFMSRCETIFAFHGQSPETYRLFEAAMAGCIVVHDILPDVWYYKDLPYIPCEHKNFNRVQEYINTHKADLRILTGIWWQKVASPVAVGKKIVEFANKAGI